MVGNSTNWQDTKSVTNVLAPESYWAYFLPLDRRISYEGIQVLATSCSLGLRRMMPSVEWPSMVDQECQDNQRPFRLQCNGRKSTQPWGKAANIYCLSSPMWIQTASNPFSWCELKRSNAAHQMLEATVIYSSEDTKSSTGQLTAGAVIYFPPSMSWLLSWQLDTATVIWGEGTSTEKMPL